MFHYLSGNSRGVSIVELLVVIFVVSVAFAGILTFASFSLLAASLAQQNTEANALLAESVEAVRNFRDGVSWNNDDPDNNYDGLGVVALAVPYRMRLSADPVPKWQLVQGAETVGIFTKQLVFSGVQRNGADQIVESGGVLDPNTKKIVATISWQERGRSHDIAITTYLTNWR